MKHVRSTLMAFAMCLLAARPIRAESMMGQLGDAIRDGTIQMTIEMHRGQIPVARGWSLSAEGEPVLAIAAEAREGKLTHARLTVSAAPLVLVGSGLKPNIVLDSMEVSADGRLSAAKFHGRGFGRLIIGLFRGMALSAVKKIPFRMDLPAVLRGEMMAAPAPAHATPTAVAPVAPPPAGAVTSPEPGFLDLIDRIAIGKSRVTAFPNRRLVFGTALTFDTAGEPGHPLDVAIEAIEFRPARGAEGTSFSMLAELSGDLASGTLAIGEDKVVFARGHVGRGHLALAIPSSGPVETHFSADDLALEASDGSFTIPPAIRVALASGSHLHARKFSLEPPASVSGIFDLDLAGRTGRIRRHGNVLSLDEVSVKATDLALAANRATGDMALAFRYRVVSPFTITYPRPEIAPRKVMLDFEGPLAADLRLENAGDGVQGRVTGVYRFKVPWEPIEKVAFEALQAKWIEDLPAVHQVSFQIEPAAFRPCGGDCFLAGFAVAAEKKSGRHTLFSENCAPEGRAKLVVDRRSRSLSLRDLKIETRCEGLTGKLVNFLAPLFASTYSDVTLFKLPPELPFDIDAVRSGTNWLEIAGTIDWRGGADQPAPAADRNKP